jgi:hypothetical protein
LTLIWRLRIIESRANLPGPDIWLIIRCNLDDPSVIKLYFSNAAADTPLIEFVRISGMGWPIETVFKEAKGEVGFGHYEMQSWLGWHHLILPQPCFGCFTTRNETTNLTYLIARPSSLVLLLLKPILGCNISLVLTLWA